MVKLKVLLLLTAVTAAVSCGPSGQRATTVVVPAPPRAVWHPEALPLPAVRSAALAQNADPTNSIIEQAEKTYNEGMADYRAGNLEAAKDKFDAALRLILESNQDVEGNDRLNAEFDKLVENIHDVELAAVERGDTLSEHRYEAPPIESFAGLTFPVDPKVKEQVQHEVKLVRSDLPLVSNDYVDGVITYLQKHGKKYIQTVLDRRGLYQPLISSELSKQGLPQDLIYLAAGESGFNPFALSRQGALGIWQFMAGTGALYGLKRDRWVDEREDPAKATRAAARHLKDLYQTFGDWYLAMAAYDWSPNGVQHAIERTGYADFWTLRKLHVLPVETENYVPIFLATALIAKDPKAYGFDVPPNVALTLDQEVVTVPTDLRLVAQLIDRPVEELVRLNPSLLRWTTPANDPGFVLNLPAGTKQQLDQALASIPPDKRIWWRAHKVESGETWAAIARKFKVSPTALVRANQQVAENRPLEEGTRLVVPLGAGDERSLQRVRARGARRLSYYRVRAGDTLDLVADRFDVSAFEIRRWNNLKSSRLTAGASLKVYTAARSAPASRRHLTRHQHSSSSQHRKSVARTADAASDLSASAPAAAASR